MVRSQAGAVRQDPPLVQGNTPGKGRRENVVGGGGEI